MAVIVLAFEILYRLTTCGLGVMFNHLLIHLVSRCSESSFAIRTRRLIIATLTRTRTTSETTETIIIDRTDTTIGIRIIGDTGKNPALFQPTTFYMAMDVQQ